MEKDEGEEEEEGDRDFLVLLTTVNNGQMKQNKKNYLGRNEMKKGKPKSIFPFFF